jgi:hypothetical protein
LAEGQTYKNRRLHVSTVDQTSPGSRWMFPVFALAVCPTSSFVNLHRRFPPKRQKYNMPFTGPQVLF